MDRGRGSSGRRVNRGSGSRSTGRREDRGRGSRVDRGGGAACESRGTKYRGSNRQFACLEGVGGGTGEAAGASRGGGTEEEGVGWTLLVEEVLEGAGAMEVDERDCACLALFLAAAFVCQPHEQDLFAEG